ncbi:Uncharacterised protein [Mycobacteroides abscessus subsp. abscessus]|nr:Uncharacterised protein [Mycobacteroides abscessus subsp. abscessus]
MLGHRRCRLAHQVGQLIDREFTGGERPQDPHARGVSQHPKDLDHQPDLLIAQRWPIPLFHLGRSGQPRTIRTES